MSFAAVAGSVVSGVLGARSAKKQRNATQRAQEEEQKLYRPNQYSPWGATEWTQDDKGNWTQKSTLDPQDAARLQQFRDIAGYRMEKAKSFLHDPSEYKIDYSWASRQPRGSLGGYLGGGGAQHTPVPTFSNPLSHFYQPPPGGQRPMVPTAAGLGAPVTPPAAGLSGIAPGLIAPTAPTALTDSPDPTTPAPGNENIDPMTGLPKSFLRQGQAPWGSDLAGG